MALALGSAPGSLAGLKGRCYASRMDDDMRQAFERVDARLDALQDALGDMAAQINAKLDAVLAGVETLRQDASRLESELRSLLH